MIQAENGQLPSEHDVVQVTHPPHSVSYERLKGVKPSHRDELVGQHTPQGRLTPYRLAFNAFL